MNVERDLRLARLLMDEMEPLHAMGDETGVVDYLRTAANAILAPYGMLVTYCPDVHSPRVPLGRGAFRATMKRAAA